MNLKIFSAIWILVVTVTLVTSLIQQQIMCKANHDRCLQDQLYGTFVPNYNNKMSLIFLFIFTTLVFKINTLHNIYMSSVQSLFYSPFIDYIWYANKSIEFIVCINICNQIDTYAFDKFQTKKEQELWFYCSVFVLIIIYNIIPLTGLSLKAQVELLNAILLIPQIWRNSIKGFNSVPSMAHVVSIYAYILVTELYIDFVPHNIFFKKSDRERGIRITAITSLSLFIYYHISKDSSWLIPRRFRRWFVYDNNMYMYDYTFEEEANRSNLSYISDEEFLAQIRNDPHCPLL